MPIFTAGQPLTAAALNDALGETKSNDQLTSGTTTATGYTATLTGGTACSTLAVIPTSGKLIVHNTCQVSNNNAAGTALCAFEVRNGSVVGSGSVLYAASDDDAVNTAGNTSLDRKTVTVYVGGLTPGITVNIRQVFRVNNNTGTFFRKELIAQPVA